MSELQISLFGCIHLTHRGESSEPKITRTGEALLAYLLLQRHRNHPRQVLAGLFWGNYPQERAHSCLNTALWRLRRVLEPRGVPRGSYLIVTSLGEIGFNRESDYWLDVEVFESRLTRLLVHPIHRMNAAQARELQEALELYSAPLLDGFYDDWALRERERLRLLHLNALAHLTRYYHHQREYESSLACGRRILEHDPLREEIHRELMRIYVASGQRALAVRQYETCREILATELAIAPMEETQRLYRHIISGANEAASLPEPFGNVNDMPDAVAELHRAIQTFDRAREQLEQAIHQIEQFGATPPGRASEPPPLHQSSGDKSVTRR